MEQEYESTELDELYNQAFAKMHEILGVSEPPGTLFGDLHNAADKALVVFRDVLTAAVCAQAGVYRSVKDPQVDGVEGNIDHAEHELGLCIEALQRAKATLSAAIAAQAPEGLVTIQEYARMRGVSVRTVQKWIKMGMPIVTIQ